MSLCENIAVAIQRFYITIAVINTLGTFLENILGEVSQIGKWMPATILT